MVLKIVVYEVLIIHEDLLEIRKQVEDVIKICSVNWGLSLINHCVRGKLVIN